MLDLYYWATPNGHKITLFLEEAELSYNLHPVNILQGEQFAPEFLKISPNNKIPALVDSEPKEGSAPVSLFESGAILLYLAEKTGQFLPPQPRQRWEALKWLFWQVGGLGPMSGQNHHFNHAAPETIPYAIERFAKETLRLYGVLNHHLNSNEFIAGNYSIADMACYPWIVPHKMLNLDLSSFPALERWHEAIAARPATVRAYAKASLAKAESMP